MSNYKERGRMELAQLYFQRTFTPRQVNRIVHYLGEF